MRSFTGDDGARWQVMIGKESWGTLVLLFSPEAGGDARTSILQAETTRLANAELDALSDEALRAHLRDSRPWS